jgi:hypothetical protein
LKTRLDPRAAAAASVAAPVAVLLVYLAALAFRRDAVPAGLCNDTAEEALRGAILLAERRLEPITSVLGNSAETLYLYLLGLSAGLLGRSPGRSGSASSA